MGVSSPYVIITCFILCILCAPAPVHFQFLGMPPKKKVVAAVPAIRISTRAQKKPKRFRPEQQSTDEEEESPSTSSAQGAGAPQEPLVSQLLDRITALKQQLKEQVVEKSAGLQLPTTFLVAPTSSAAHRNSAAVFPGAAST